ncbi:hypothetical protein E1H12_12675 [Geitlerinema sp. P-1104]|uniref:hypothetical protein n=1 Tax=Geitlerinema sp. P-1104 TaxID=2546230 RepID=UPI0014774FE7|nr:hypothetical protein [Geitlerinema sp. P-1104]NMG59346.1 hypothetical protein [Geitlerinema sp. P-1104]
MLFVIDETIADVLELGDENCQETKDIVEVLTSLAISWKHGKHIIYSSRPALKKLSESSLLGKFSECYKRIELDLTTIKEYKNKLIRHIEIVSGSRKKIYIPQCQESGGKKVLIIPVSQLAKDNSIFDKTMLLCEEDDDQYFYVKITEIYKLISRIKCPLQYESSIPSGHGDKTGDYYKKIQEEARHLCLCIADSDRKFPSDSHKATACKIVDNDDPSKLLTEHFIIDVHEIENLIPTDLIRSVISNRRTIDSIKILDKHYPEARLFLDLKKGLKLVEILDQGGKEKFCEYWRNVIQETGLYCNEFCTDLPNCSSKDKCTCTIFEGNITLRKVIKHLQNENLSDHKLKEMLDKNLEKKWCEIGSLVWAWCCGSQRKSGL